MSTIPLEPPNAHEVAAQAFLAQLRTMQQTIPGFTFLGPDEQATFNATASVSDRFLELVGLACDNSEPFASVSDVTGPQLRDLVAYHRAYTTLLGAVEVFTRGLRQTLIIRRGEIGDRALRAYAAGKGLNRKGRPPIVPEVKEIGLALNRGRRKATPPPVAETPPIIPTPTPTIPAPRAAALAADPGSDPKKWGGQ